MFFNINDILELSGSTPIIVHRLMKNSITADEYVLMTVSAFADLGLSREEVEMSSEKSKLLSTINHRRIPTSPMAHQIFPKSLLTLCERK
jgi:hypothetical protein